MSNSRIGPFVLEERLGGARSSVFRALQVAQKRAAALRIFPSSLIATAAGRSAFSAEAALLKKLTHPSIARCHGGGLEGTQAYIAYDLVRGETLAKLLERRGRIAWEQVVAWGKQLCGALAQAHELGLLHLDLTPDKLIIAEDGRIVVTDFRQDRTLNPLCASSLVKTPERLAYQSPEQIQQQSPLTLKADLYSLGCILFTMLAGQPPCGSLEGKEMQQIAELQVNAIPPRVSSIVLDCPVWLEAVVEQLLQKDPMKRPHSAGAALLALEEAERKLAAGVGVMQHAVGGFSTIKMQVDKSEAGRILGIRKPAAPKVPFHEQTWFIATALTLLSGFLIFALSIPFWPVKETVALEKAERLMATGDMQNWSRARTEFLEPLFARTKDPAIKAKVQEHLDKIEMQLAENRTNNFLERSWPIPTSEVAKQYAQACKLLRFGDQEAAFKKFEAVQQIASETGDDRPFRLLAQSKLAGVTIAADRVSKQEFIASKLAEADKLRAEQKVAEAKKMLEGIVSLYENEPDLRPQVKAARERLDSLGGEKSPAKSQSASQPSAVAEDETPMPSEAAPAESISKPE